MIYLLRSFGKGASILKIGFSDTLDNRLSQYFYHNPLSEVVDTKEGDEKIEKLLHLYLGSLGYSFNIDGKLSEWYKDIQEVIDIFNLSSDDLCKKVWGDRNSVFDIKNFKRNGYQYKIYEYLYESQGKPELQYERFFLSENNKEVILNKNYIEVDKLYLDLSGIYYDAFFEVSNERSWEVSQEDYQDQVNSMKVLESVPGEILEYLDKYKKLVKDFLDNHFYKTGVFREKMKLYCDFMDSVKGNKEIENILYYKIKDDRFRKYYRFYGTSGCRAISYEELKLYEGMSDSSKGEELTRAVYGFFKIGERYTKKEIKSGLEVIYRDLGITSRKPKTSDLGNYFKLTRTRITNKDTGKLDEGYKLDLL